MHPPPLDIFSDIGDIVYRLFGTSQEDIATGIHQLLESADLLGSEQKIQDQWLAAHSRGNIGRRRNGMIQGRLRG